MTDGWFGPDALFDGATLRRGAGFKVEGGVVVETSKAPPADARRIPGLVTPGFIDLQVNGGGGVLFNTNPTPEGARAIAAAHRQFGTCHILPTLITDAPDVLTRAADAILEVAGSEGILGLHIEGPHIAPAKRGTHAETHIRPFDSRTLAEVERLRRAGIPVLITLAPEAASADDIARLSNLGAVVSLGHSNADEALAQKAIEAGATAATHLYNAMSPMTSRAPGLVGTVINSGLVAGVIVDGHHVDDAMVALALRARPSPNTMFLVSDAMPTVGGPDSFELYGRRITLTNGRLVNAEGALAGAHLTMAGALRRCVSAVGVPLDEALRMATLIPAMLIGAPEAGRITGQSAGNVLVLDEALETVGTLSDLPVKSRAKTDTKN